MKGSSSTATGAVANLAAQGLPFLLLIVVTPVLITALGRGRYGALILFNLIAQIAGQLDLGLSTAATRGFAHYAALADRASAMRLFLETLISLALWGLVLGLVFYLFRAQVADALKLRDVVSDDSSVYLAGAMTIPLAMANGALLVPLRALERYGQAARIQVASGLCYWIACTAWAQYGASVAQLVALGTATVAVTSLFLFHIAHTTQLSTTALPLGTATTVRHFQGSTRILLRDFLPVGTSAFVAQFSSLVTFHADKLIVSGVVSPAAAGAYTICTSLANKILLVIASAATFTFPRSTQLHASGDIDGLVATYRSSTRLCAALAMTALVPMVGFAHAFLSLWLGPAFATDYAVVLRLLAVGYALASLSVVAANTTMGMGKGRIAAVFAVTGAAITLAFLALLAPRFGVAGAAVASLLGMSQAVVFNTLVSRRLGRSTSGTSGLLVLQLVAIGLPIALLIAAFSSLIRDWTVLAATGAIGIGLFPLAWCMTFGRNEEWPVLKRFVAAVKAR